MIELALAVLALLLASAIASGSEAAIFSLPISKAKAQKGPSGRAMESIKDRPARPISVIVILNNLSNIVGTFLVASIAASVLPKSSLIWFPWALTVAVILLAEILTKTLGERYCVSISRIVARPLLWLTWLMTPVVFLIEKFTSAFAKGNRPSTSEIEIRLLASMARQEGIIENDEAEHISRVFELNDVLASDIMTPRTALTWLRGSDKLREVKAKVGMSEHSRIVVVGETIDEVKGVLLKSKVLELLTTDADLDQPVERFIEPVPVFAQSTPSDDLLEHFKTSRLHLAVVIDEYNGVAGVVTLEDVLEVLTGEIVDETDTCADLQLQALENGRNRLGESHDHINAEFRKQSSRRMESGTPATAEVSAREVHVSAANGNSES